MAGCQRFLRLLPLLLAALFIIVCGALPGACQDDCTSTQQHGALSCHCCCQTAVEMQPALAMPASSFDLDVAFDSFASPCRSPLHQLERPPRA